MADKPSGLSSVTAMLFDPGGDVDGIRRAETACRKLSADLIGVLAGLEPTAKGLADGWHGPASDGFQACWQKFNLSLRDYAKYLDAVADSLANIAALLAEAQVQSRNFEIMLAATVATAAAMTFFTFGFSDVAAAEELAFEANAMEVMLARVGALMAGEAEAISALTSAITSTIARFALGVGFSTISSMLVKGLVRHQNVLDPANWDAKDVSKILLDGTLVMLSGVTGSAKLSALMKAHPYLGYSAVGAGLSGVFSGVSQFWFDHASPFDPQAWLNVGQSMAIGGGTGLGLAGLFVGIPKVVGGIRGAADPVIDAAQPSAGLRIPGGKPLFPVQRFPDTAAGIAVTRSDVQVSVTGLGSDMVNYMINYPRAAVAVQGPSIPPLGPTTLTVPSAAQLPPASMPQPPSLSPPAPSPPAPSPPAPSLAPPPAPPHPGPGLPQISIRVHSGDSLWAIARHVYGDGNRFGLIAAANHVSAPYIIQPGQVLTIPALHIEQPDGVTAKPPVRH